MDEYIWLNISDSQFNISTASFSTIYKKENTNLTKMLLKENIANKNALSLRLYIHNEHGQNYIKKEVAEYR